MVVVKQSYLTAYRNHTCKLIYFLKEEGYSFERIASVMGITYQGVQKILSGNLKGR